MNLKDTFIQTSLKKSADKPLGNALARPVITRQDIEVLHRNQQEYFVLPAGSIVTAAARDVAREYAIRLIETGLKENPQQAPASVKGQTCQLIEQVKGVLAQRISLDSYSTDYINEIIRKSLSVYKEEKVRQGVSGNPQEKEASRFGAQPLLSQEDRPIRMGRTNQNGTLAPSKDAAQTKGLDHSNQGNCVSHGSGVSTVRPTAGSLSSGQVALASKASELNSGDDEALVFTGGFVVTGPSQKNKPEALPKDFLCCLNSGTNPQSVFPFQVDYCSWEKGDFSYTSQSDSVVVVLKGSLAFSTGQKTVSLKPGDALCLERTTKGNFMSQETVHCMILRHG